MANPNNKRGRDNTGSGRGSKIPITYPKKGSLSENLVFPDLNRNPPESPYKPNNAIPIEVLRDRKQTNIVYAYYVKLGGKCSTEGCDEDDPVALDFHHVDGTVKSDNVSNMYTAEPVRFIAEISKCVLLCKNCHAKLHAKENQTASYLMNLNHYYGKKRK
jgi:hypothetical protein